MELIFDELKRQQREFLASWKQMTGQNLETLPLPIRFNKSYLSEPLPDRLDCVPGYYENPVQQVGSETKVVLPL